MCDLLGWGRWWWVASGHGRLSPPTIHLLLAALLHPVAVVLSISLPLLSTACLLAISRGGGRLLLVLLLLLFGWGRWGLVGHRWLLLLLLVHAPILHGVGPPRLHNGCLRGNVRRRPVRRRPTGWSLPHARWASGPLVAPSSLLWHGRLSLLLLWRSTIHGEQARHAPWANCPTG